MKDFNTVQSISSELKVTPHTVRRWINEGKLEAFRPNRKLYITRRAFEKMIEKTRVQNG